jgi:hypothetical protein
VIHAPGHGARGQVLVEAECKARHKRGGNLFLLSWWPPPAPLAACCVLRTVGWEQAPDSGDNTKASQRREIEFIGSGLGPCNMRGF